MWYCYVLQSINNGKRYVGSTNNLKRRLEEHNDGTGGAYTRRNRPFILLYYEAYQDKSCAKKAEMFYKTGFGREVLNGKLTVSK